MSKTVKPSFELPKGTFRRTTRTIAVILWTLYLEGGEVESIAGHGISALRAAANRHDISIDGIPGPTLTTLLQDLGGGKYGNAIYRDDRGAKNKLYSLQLLIGEELLPPDPRPPKPEPEPEPEVIEEPEPEEIGVADVPDTKRLSPVPVARDETYSLPDVTTMNGNGHVEEPVTFTPRVRPEPPIDALLHIQSLAAGALIALSQMAGYLDPSATEARAADDVVAERLAKALEENERLRRKVKEHEETIYAQGKENRGLRQSVLQLQANLDAIRNGGQVNHEALRALRDREKLMQEKPKVKA